MMLGDTGVSMTEPVLDLRELVHWQGRLVLSLFRSVEDDKCLCYTVIHYPLQGVFGVKPVTLKQINKVKTHS